MLTRLLIFCFKSNHDPGKQFLEAYSQALYRDMDNMSGRRILNSAIILAAFNHLPTYLAKGIFSNEFMNKLDSEIKMYDDSRSYNAQLRYLMRNNNIKSKYPDLAPI
ncbi:uncharacterized protein LOC111696530 [Eurytemora carolleeae]|uniref:uncharacterized protein LOC111696530 n=1 Tax=Eurytemora carolleeae TaxID=1294199 RepID=UPI000C793128|nr:uncharacterized protein LOC111696530 [Eurytemora carolleeae]|eukprot:XP_023321918.1 uncharacterized protein LOC111696530 [Eurytemora affinis]